MTKFLRFLLPYWWQVLVLFAGLGLQVWSALQLPDMMSQIVNQGIVGGDQGFIMTQGLLMLVVTLVGGVGMLVAGFFAARVGAGLARQVREDVFKKVMSFSISEIGKFSTSSLITRTTNDVMQLQMVTTMVLRMSCQAPLMGVGAIIKAMDTAPGMSWIIMLAVAALLVVIVTVFCMALPKFKILQKLVDKLNLVTRENLTGLRVVRAFNNEKHEEAKFDTANTDLMKVNLFVNRVMVVMMPVVQLVLNFTMLLVIWVGASYIDSGAIEIGNMMAFMQYAMQVMMSFMFLTMAFIMVPRAAVSWKRITEVLDTQLSIKPAKKPKKAQSSKRGTVEFKNVSFAYEDAEEPVLKNISFTAQPGQTTAFIGSTGSGKSTLINLVPRFYDATKGQVLVDGVNVRDYEQKDLMQKIGLVPQKGVLFSGSVKSNIAFGANDASGQQIKKAAKIAQAYDFVEKLDGEFDAHIAQGGSNVSGGQKQRLSIARAVAKDPEIYIFDDSFSALDFKTDLSLRAALKPVTKKAAVLIVAQRVGTIKHADQIVVLDDGKVAGIGTHYELLKSCAVYKEIAASQLSEDELNAELEVANG
ncbi:MAG: ABC transporter ATP-binding protein/permease [Candidatus Nomurabacteria bacterium]|jgi:ATP-binding cassette subfamily B protein|nr:ABC transporter ATP-binding protein/permease [Candidatus Nomurabacteria bacterium]